MCGRSRFLEFCKQCGLLPLLSIVVVSQHITAACDVSGLVLQLLWSGIGMEASTTVGSETVRVQFRCAVITAAVRRDTSSSKQHVRKLGQSGRTTQSVSDRGCMCWCSCSNRLFCRHVRTVCAITGVAPEQELCGFPLYHHSDSLAYLC